MTTLKVDEDLECALMEQFIEALHQRCTDIPRTQLCVLAISFNRFILHKSPDIFTYIQYYQQKLNSYGFPLPPVVLKSLQMPLTSPEPDADERFRDGDTEFDTAGVTASSCFPVDVKSPSVRAFGNVTFQSD
ncbi:hypothetical protein POMI540_0426 [Schizosaccharomyces pombe]|uniref:Uncharacterized protein C11D3.16c n=1 Tax=Schizosaccharomyces pombe (strain 972 / ATCC 24843) TaxID=284812 RepID=YAOG_SCHPO|nr:uncharacterized protein SPAC11D3.16c [Schizosaccharomyces pombe]Q10095.1 RecName: Full=Uncharacterized protein C11D3.16c [Schizosaccharomyces pombe 972h-]CAA92317.1 sequence orphan [Schizosaccharomyces pombe]|eukprot:NP_592811.1 uncharacterized protein SPAC11D3.16c [Schizosaccharomyces pombe]